MSVARLIRFRCLREPVPAYSWIVPIIRYRGVLSPLSASSSDFSASAVSSSSTCSCSTASPTQTRSAASRLAPPENTESLRRTIRSASVRSSQLQSITARSVLCRGSAVRLPLVSSRNRSSSRWAS